MGSRRLALVSLNEASCNALERRMEHLNLLWGTTCCEERLRARAVGATAVPLFRQPVDRRRYIGEEREHVPRRLAAHARETQWRARHGARDTLGRFEPGLREALRGG